MNIPIKPLGDRVVVKVAPPETKKGGLLLPNSAQQQSYRGTIVRIGDGDAVKSCGIKVGDDVMYGKYYGSDVVHEGDEYRVLRVTECFAVLEGNGKG